MGRAKRSWRKALLIRPGPVRLIQSHPRSSSMSAWLVLLRCSLAAIRDRFIWLLPVELRSSVSTDQHLPSATVHLIVEISQSGEIFGAAMIVIDEAAGT